MPFIKNEKYTEDFQNFLKKRRDMIMELDRTKTYDLSKLNDKQLKKVHNWLKQNDNGWNNAFEDFKQSLSYWFLQFDDEWYCTRDKSKFTCATELFKKADLDTKIIELIELCKQKGLKVIVTFEEL